MGNIVENLNSISKTVDKILDFVANDKVLSEDFEQYLKSNNIELESENQFNNVIIEYVFDKKMQNGLRVLEYFKRNNSEDEKILNSFLNSFCGVFKVNKVLSNGFNVKCLTSEIDLTLIPLVKMQHLKQIGKNDNIVARILELENEQYILEIYDVISEYDEYSATNYAIQYLLQNPKSAYYKNPELKEKLKLSVKNFYEKFIEYFNKDFVVTTNKKVDELLAQFNLFRLDNKKTDFSSLIEKVGKNRYIKIQEYQDNSSNFLSRAMGGFSSHKETYDVGLFVDEKRGLYAIPFLDTFFKCFKEEIELKNECINEFLTNDKIPPSIIKLAYENNENFFDVINECLNTDFSNFEELMFNTKTSFVDEGIFSPIVILFNSNLFSKMIEIDENSKLNNITEKKNKVGRNDLCPCGSGLKYKKCCGQ